MDSPDRPDAVAQFGVPTPSAVPPVGGPVGALLRAAREEAGLSIRDVADALRIQYLYIQALEESNHGKLPGSTYAIGFLRTYCQFLELDVEELVQRYKEEQAGLDRKPDLVFPTPVPESKVPGAALILVSVLLLALAYGAWAFFSGDDPAVADLVPAVPERLQDLMAGEESEESASPAGEEQAATPNGGNFASLPNTSSPVFVLPRPDEENGGMSSVPVETPAALESHEPAPEPEPSEPVVVAVPSSDAGVVATPVEEPAEIAVPVEEPAEIPAATVAVQPPVPEPAPSVEPVAEATSAEGPGTLIEFTEPLAVPAPEFAEEAATTEVVEVTATPEPASQIAAIPEAPGSEAIPSAPATEAPAQGADEHIPRVYGAANANARIILRAIQDSWVQVRDSEDSLLLTRLLRAGDSYRVPNRTDLTMLTGNAGGLQIEVDGNRLGTLGPVGKVRRDVTLDPARLLQDPNLTR